MTIETILKYLNAVPVRATYGAVGDVLGIRPQTVPRLLGAQRPEASWIVNGSTGEPTGYTRDQVDPRLPGTPVIRTGDELRRCLERDAAPDAVSAVNGAVGPRMPEAEIVNISSDAKWIIGTLVPVILLVAGLLAAQIASVSDSLNTRIDDVNDRIDDLQADITAQIAGVPTRVDEVRTELANEIAVLRSAVDSVAGRLNALDPVSGRNDPNPVPAPDAGEQTSDPDAPAANPDAQPEPATDPVSR